jgi:hypothetical protein
VYIYGMYVFQNLCLNTSFIFIKHRTHSDVMIRYCLISVSPSPVFFGKLSICPSAYVMQSMHNKK